LGRRRFSGSLLQRAAHVALDKPVRRNSNGHTYSYCYSYGYTDSNTNTCINSNAHTYLYAQIDADSEVRADSKGPSHTRATAVITD